MDCNNQIKKFVPLSKVVKAAIVDTYEDIGKVEQRFSHWTSRGLKKLYSETLPYIKQKVLLTVNGNTHTATLPIDFDRETFVGLYDSASGKKIALKINNSLTDTKNIVDVSCEDKCDKCNQDKNICNDLVVTEEVNLIVIDDNTYEQTVVKKLYPNGDYYLETTTPVLNIATSTVEYTTKKEFIVNFDLKPCGCLDTTEENLNSIKCFCPDIFCNYYAACDNSCNPNYGGYRIFEDSGLIQFDSYFNFDKCYLEYRGFISKKNGQYQVPQVAFETLVEYTKLKSIANKRNITRWERLDQEQSYKRERGNMEKILGRVSLYQIIKSISMLPKFDVDYSLDWYGCFNRNTELAVAATSDCVSVAQSTASQPTTSTVIYITQSDIYGKIKVVVANSGTQIITGQTVYTLKEANGSNVKKVKVDSVNVVVDGVVLVEGMTDQLSYDIVYTDSATTITFNQGAIAEQKYNITYVKTT